MIGKFEIEFCHLWDENQHTTEAIADNARLRELLEDGWDILVAWRDGYWMRADFVLRKPQ